jgi:membrane-associated phospholipid phosphatase
VKIRRKFVPYNLIISFLFFAVLSAQFKADNQFRIGNNAGYGFNTDATEDEVSDFGHFFNTGKALFMAPLNWRSDDWLKFGALSAGTGLLFFADEPVRDWVQRNYSGTDYTLMKIDRYYGYWPTLIISAGLYGYGSLGKDKDIRRLGLKSAEAFLYAGLIANLIKPVIGRSRPDNGNGNTSFDLFSLGDKNHSLPSGHTTAAFAFSTVMAEAVDNVYWDILWYGTASLTGMARIYHDKHWVSDVFAGAALGYVIGHFVSGQSWYNSSGGQSLSVNAYPVSVNYTFVIM